MTEPDDRHRPQSRREKIILEIVVWGGTAFVLWNLWSTFGELF